MRSSKLSCASSDSVFVPILPSYVGMAQSMIPAGADFFISLASSEPALPLQNEFQCAISELARLEFEFFALQSGQGVENSRRLRQYCGGSLKAATAGDFVWNH